MPYVAKPMLRMNGLEMVKNSLLYWLKIMEKVLPVEEKTPIKTETEIQVSLMKLECVKIASKHSYDYNDIKRQSKELMGLIDFL